MIAIRRQLLVKGRTLGFPFHHGIIHFADDFTRIAHNQAAPGYLFASLDETQRADDAFIAQFDLIHKHCVHADEAIRTNGSTMDHCAVPDMSPTAKQYPDTGKHVDGAVLLDIAAIFDDNLPPIAPYGRTGTDVHVPAQDDIAGNCCLGVHKS